MATRIGQRVVYATNDCVNAAGALDIDFKTGMIARSRSTLSSSESERR